MKIVPPQDYRSQEYKEWEDKFSDYMFENSDGVKELLDLYFEN